MKRLSAIALSVAAALTVIAPSASDQAYRNEIEQWREGRIERLKRPTGWFSLVGLHWLNDGTNTAGSDPSSDIIYAAGLAPPRLGTFHYAAGKVEFTAEAGVPVLHDGRPVTKLRMYADTDEEHDLTVLAYGSLRLYVIERSGSFGIRAKDENWSDRIDFTGIPSYPVEERWRIDARLVRYEMPQFISIVDVNDMQADQPTPGKLVFELDGRTFELSPIAEPGADKLFIVFGDETNGRETYGAGRFLYADAPGEDGRVVLDFNRAYNPPCAFTPYATCPLPPRQNHLAVRITAGEKSYGHSPHN